MKKVILTFDSPGDVSIEQEIFGDFANIQKIPCLTEEDILQYCKEADAVITCYEPFNEQVIKQLPKLKVISCKSIGTNYVDIDAATKAGIIVTNIPEYCVNEVADQTVAFMLAINRRIVQYNISTHREKQWKYDLFQDMQRFSKQIIGLLGLGRIPRLVAKRLQAFDCQVIAYDPYIDQNSLDGLNVELKSLDEVIQQSDYLSCHLPLMESTRGFINRDLLNQMKKGSVFINTSRGGVVNERDLIEALQSEHISYCALDVVEDETPDMSTNPLSDMDQVILTPHTAYLSVDSTYDAKVQSAQNVLNALKGKYDKCHIVNTKIFSKEEF